MWLNNISHWKRENIIPKNPCKPLSFVVHKIVKFFTKESLSTIKSCHNHKIVTFFVIHNVWKGHNHWEIVTFLSFIIPEKVIKLGNCDLFVVHNYWKGHNSHSNYMSKAEGTALLKRSQLDLDSIIHKKVN